MNTIQLVGRLTREPELGATAGGKAVCDMRLAVPRRDRDADPVYVDLIAYDALAELCAEHLEKGRQVAVTGRLDYQEWEARDGSGRRSRHQVVAGEIDFLARPAADGSHEQPAAEPSRV
jgi:single-strand DNA-binding protein